MCSNLAIITATFNDIAQNFNWILVFTELTNHFRWMNFCPLWIRYKIMILKNAFFDLALTQAARIAGKPIRMVRLLGQLAFKLRSVNWKSVNGPLLKEKFMLLGRLLKAHVNGQYRVKSLKFLLILIAAVIYFLNPLDLIPDFIIGIGLTDDLAVLTWVFQAAASELEAYTKWEKSIIEFPIVKT